jgi:MSHA biogenesis protein MshO
MHSASRHRGFTMIEMVMVIVILGVVGGMVAVFMRGPIDAYVATGHRAALTDVADATARRMARDISKALPNSVLNPNPTCIEFVPTKTGGRYRADDTASGLDFARPDTSFNMLGDNSALPANQQIAVGDIIAIYNLGISGASAYDVPPSNISAVTAIAADASAPVAAPQTKITIDAKQFPLASPGNRFHVIPANEQVVAYVCTAGRLMRTVRTLAAAACPDNGSTMATDVSACNFDYAGSDLQRNALVRLQLGFTRNGETASLYHEVHVGNAP